MGANGIERYWSVAFTTGNMGYIGTGQDSLGNNLNDFWQYYPSSDKIPLSVNNLKSSSTIQTRVYPNPSNGTINFTYDGLSGEKSEIIITDMLGRNINSYEITGKQGMIILMKRIH